MSKHEDVSKLKPRASEWAAEVLSKIPQLVDSVCPLLSQ